MKIAMEISCGGGDWSVEADNNGGTVRKSWSF